MTKERVIMCKRETSEINPAIGPLEVYNRLWAIGWTEAFRNRWKEFGKDTRYLSTNGGPFSVSRITICIGQLSLIVWSLVGVDHLALLMLSHTTVHTYLVESGIIVLGFMLVLFSAIYLLFFL